MDAQTHAHRLAERVFLAARQTGGNCTSQNCISFATTCTNYADYACTCKNLDKLTACITDCPSYFSLSTTDIKQSCATLGYGSSSPSSVGIIVGVIIAVIVLSSCAAGVYFLVRRRRRGLAGGGRYSAAYMSLNQANARLTAVQPGGFGDDIGGSHGSLPPQMQMAPEPAKPAAPAPAPAPATAPPPSNTLPSLYAAPAPAASAPPPSTMTAAAELPPYAQSGGGIARTSSRKADLAPAGAPPTPAAGNTTGPVGFTPGSVYTVMTQGYLAVEADELTVRYGDQVRVDSVYDDGWAMGYNTTTNKPGLFPFLAIRGKQ